MIDARRAAPVSRALGTLGTRAVHTAFVEGDETLALPAPAQNDREIRLLAPHRRGATPTKLRLALATATVRRLPSAAGGLEHGPGERSRGAAG